MRASIAFVLAVASKLLPIVLVPLFWKRVRRARRGVAALVLAALYYPFRSAGILPLGAVPNVVASIRFNGPLFMGLRLTSIAEGGRGRRGAGGLGVAAWMRCAAARPSDPAAWAWPMAVSLAAAPVIYPWYLLYFTPFLFTRATLPLSSGPTRCCPSMWSGTSRSQGHRWIVPTVVVWFEFGVVLWC